MTEFIRSNNKAFGQTSEGVNVPLKVDSQGRLKAHVSGVLDDISYIDFDTDFEATHQEGRLHWNSDDGTLEIGLPGGNVLLQVGQESLIRVTNNQGSQINNGQLVYINSASGNNPYVKIANNTDLSNIANKTLAMATENISNNQKGYVTTFGLVRDINTSGCVAGNILYLNSTGGFTNVMPASPSIVMEIGICLRAHATEGVVFVTIKDKEWLRLLQGAKRGPNGFEKSADGEPPTDSVIAYDSSTRTISIAPTGTHFNYWLNAIKYQVTESQELTHPDTSGTYFFYWDSDNTLTFSTTIWSIFDDVLIAYVYYNADLNDGYCFEERHGADRNTAWHYSQHFLTGTFWHNGEGLGIDNYIIQPVGPSDSDNQFTLDAGEIHDEDISIQINATVGGTYRIFYRSGNNGDWTWSTNNVPLLAGTYIQYNEYTGATWQLTQLATNNYMNLYVIVVPIINGNTTAFVVLGQNVYTTLSDAQEESAADLTFGSFPFQETLFAYKITMRTNASYTTEGKCRIAALEDTRLSTNRSIISAAPSANHGSLAGLANDDHTQYLLADGTRALTGNWDAGSYKITAETIESDVATGTAPFTVASTTLVSNLNSDLLDGQQGSYYLSRANHTGTQLAATISDFDTEVSNNASVSANTAKVTNANHSGEVTGDGALTITAGAVTYSKIQNIAANNVLLGNDNGTTQTVQELTAADVRTILNVENGAEANNISDVNATDLTDTGDSSLHYHSTDRNRANHTGNRQLANPGSNLTADGEIVTMTNGNAGAVAFGDVCFIASDGDMEFADASDSSTMPGIYMATATINAAASGNWLRTGLARNDSWSWTPGAFIYISTTGTTGNTLTATAPSGSGVQVQQVGIAKTATIIDFKPELTIVEV